MPLQIVRNDITRLACDAIVNAANETLLGGGGVDGAIHRAAGPGLLKECSTLGGCAIGQAKITGGYRLPSKYVIHTVGPVWRGGAYGEERLLSSCYRQSLLLAQKYRCGSVAFPLISSGVYGYPKREALQVAVRTIQEFLLTRDTDMQVYIVVFDKASFQIGEKLYADIAAYIDDHYVDDHTDPGYEYMRQEQCSQLLPEKKKRPAFSFGQKGGKKETQADDSIPILEKAPDMAKAGRKSGLERRLSQIDESFSQMLIRKIDEKGMTDVQCYKKANIDRKLFSKIRSHTDYRPKKTTVIAFAFALELSLEDTKEMLMKAGYALSHSSKFDIIIEYFINQKNYDVFQVNEALFAYDQSLLGA